MKTFILVFAASFLTVDSAPPSIAATDVESRCVGRLGTDLGGHIFDLIAGVLNLTTVDWYVNDLQTSISTPPTPNKVKDSIVKYNALWKTNSSINELSEYAKRWGNGVGGSLHGMLNTDLVIDGNTDGPVAFLVDRITKWKNYNKNYVDDTTDPLLSADVTSLRNLAKVLGAEIGGLVYGSLAAYQAGQLADSSTPISSYLTPVLQVVVNNGLQTYAATDVDLFVCPQAASGNICFSDFSIFGTDAQAFLNQVIGGTASPQPQVQAIQYFLQQITPTTAP